MSVTLSQLDRGIEDFSDLDNLSDGFWEDLGDPSIKKQAKERPVFEDPAKALEKEKHLQKTVDKKLEEYLRLHSEKLSSHIQHFFDNSDHPEYITLDQKVSGLCLVAWERKQFTNKIIKL